MDSISKFFIFIIGLCNVNDPPYRTIPSFQIKGFFIALVQMVRNLPAMQETQVPSLGQEDPLEVEIVTHSSILAWENPMDRGAWWATVHGVAKSQTPLSVLYYRSLLYYRVIQHKRTPYRNIPSFQIKVSINIYYTHTHSFGARIKEPWCLKLQVDASGDQLAGIDVVSLTNNGEGLDVILHWISCEALHSNTQSLLPEICLLFQTFLFFLHYR